MNTSHTRLTYQDFLKFPDDGQRHELIDGEHYVTPSPNTEHQRLVVRLTIELGKYLDRHPVGQVFCAPFDCVFSDFDVVEPDVLVILDDQEDILTKQHVRGAPAIVVEILSQSTSGRDLGIKRDLYAQGGVREYWIIDPARKRLQVLARSAGGELTADNARATSDERILTTPLLPVFALNIDELFRAGR